MRKLLAMAERVARGNAAVLITGETGSGKELVARTIHHYSLRSCKPWVDVNCAALPEHLVESELFGYEKGAFSGADGGKPGLFELADNGTLFLDEIGELEPKIQVKLLRVLDGVPYYRLGGTRKVSVDVRILAATNTTLEKAVREGRFRSDLYHRLSQIQLRVPALRERPEEIIPLANYFLGKSHPDMKLSSQAQTILRSYSWPGNVRELRNVVLQSATLAQGDEVRPSDLPPEILGARPMPAVQKADSLPEPAALDNVEKQAILRTLERVGGHHGMAAQQLGISRRTLSRKLKQYNLASATTMSKTELGALSETEQQYYRATLDVPGQITAGDLHLVATVLNVSLGGVALDGVPEPLRLAAGLTISFMLPGTEDAIETKAQLVWAELHGRAGARFVDIPPDTHKRLRRWLLQKQAEEGWRGNAAQTPIDWGPDERLSTERSND